MFYSGGGVTGGNYEVGMLTAHKRSDLLDAKNWYNSPRPWMNNGSSVSQVGPGHNSFVKDEYGDLYNVYHSGHVPRHTAICPVHFRFDGSPVIDMALPSVSPFRLRGVPSGFTTLTGASQSETSKDAGQDIA